MAQGFGSACNQCHVHKEDTDGLCGRRPPARAVDVLQRDHQVREQVKRQTELQDQCPPEPIREVFDRQHKDQHDIRGAMDTQRVDQVIE